MVESKCGIICSKCAYKKQFGCPGCIKAQGKMFWGECRVAKCCIAKELEHCGKCTDFVCAILTEMSFDKEHGDNGQRIENLKKWNEL